MVTSKLRFRKSESLGILSVVVFYVAVILILWRQSGGLGYIVDNNESFGTYLHAKNLFRFGWLSSSGLTDESSGKLAASHPYLYTHQGNFPRYWSLLLLLLGVSSLESQILVTALVLGLTVILTIFFTAKRNVSLAFGLILTFLFCSAYLLVTRFFLNLWQIWSLSLIVIGTCILLTLFRQLSRVGLVGLLLCSVLLAYTEWTRWLAFLSASVIAALVVRRGQKRPLIAIVGTALLGGVMAGLILSGQIVRQLGIEGFFTDLKYTFLGRNYSASSSVSETDIFMAENNIVYWQNTAEMSRSPFELLYEAVKVVTFGFAAPLGLILTITTLAVMVRGLRWLNASRPANVGLLTRITMPWGLYALLWTVSWLTGHGFWSDLETKKQVAVFLLPLVAVGLMATWSRSSQTSYGTSLFLVSTTIFIGAYLISAEVTTSCFIVVVAMANVLVVIICQKGLQRTHALWIRLLADRLVDIGFAVAASVLFFSIAALDIPAMRNYELVSDLGLNSIWARMAIGVLVSLLALTLGDKVNWNSSNNAVLRASLIGLAASCGGCIAAFLFVPGYFVTVVLHYWQPLFFVMIFFALVPVIVILIEVCRTLSRSRGSFALGLCFVVILGLNWGFYQVKTVQLFPPSQFVSEFNALRLYSTANGVVTSEYPTPVAVLTGTWAYFVPVWNPDEESQINRTDVWLADRFVNQAYERPDLYVCSSFSSGVVFTGPRQACSPRESLIVEGRIDMVHEGGSLTIVRLD